MVRRWHHNADREREHYREEEPEEEAVRDARHERPLGKLHIFLHHVRAALGDHAQLTQHVPQRHAHRAARARHVQCRVPRRRVPPARRVCLATRLEIWDAYSYVYIFVELLDTRQIEKIEIKFMKVCLVDIPL